MMMPPRRQSKAALVFLFDVDETLLDDQRVLSDLRRHLRREVGREGDRRYWNILQRLHRALGYADYLGALQKYRQSYPHDPHVLTLSSFLINYPFAKRVFPQAMRVITRCRRVGSVVILSDGDVVFQPHKIQQSGLAAAVDDHVLVYVHKEEQIRNIEVCYPADHYVVVDDNVRILNVIKKIWRERVTTVWVRPSSSGTGRNGIHAHAHPDLTIHFIGELNRERLRAIKLLQKEQSHS